MIYALTSLAVAGVVAIVLGGFAAYRYVYGQPDILTERTRSKVLLTLKTGEGFLGVLESHDARAVVLRNVSAVGVGEQGTDQSVDGELLVMREDVSYLQVL